jgi:PAS domain S-box-containing protein
MDDIVMVEVSGVAEAMPSDMPEDADTGRDKMLRSVEHRKGTPASQVAAVRQRIAEQEASGSQEIRHEELGRSQEGRFRALVENSPDGVLIVGSDLQIMYENPSCSRILGYESGEFSGKDALSTIHPDDMSKATHALTRMIQTPDETITLRAQLRLKHKDGTWRVVDATANNLLNHPAVKGIIIDIREVTKQSRDEQAWAEDAAASARAKEHRLTPTEQRVLNLIVEGRSNPQIAEQLVVSTSTVRFHVSSVLHKLGVTSRAEAVAVAVRCRLVT